MEEDWCTWIHAVCEREKVCGGYPAVRPTYEVAHKGGAIVAPVGRERLNLGRISHSQELHRLRAGSVRE
jgi:hypothetical protein